MSAIGWLSSISLRPPSGQSPLQGQQKASPVEFLLVLQLLMHRSLSLDTLAWSSLLSPLRGSREPCWGGGGHACVLPKPPSRSLLPLFQVISVERSFVNMAPSKVEICLQKASPGAWARLEHSLGRAQIAQPPEAEAVDPQQTRGAPLDESDDSLSWSEEEWEEGGESGGLPSLSPAGN